MNLPKRAKHVPGTTPVTISDDYRRYGLRPGRHPEVWEDGIRLPTDPGLWEWWYVDAHLEDGSTIVVAFSTKGLRGPDTALQPTIAVDVDRPDGTRIERRVVFEADQFSASADRCDVSVGPNYLRGDLRRYALHVSDDDLTVDLRITRTTDSWRQKTGILEFGDGTGVFGWVVPVPQGDVTASVTYRGATFDGAGSGYHDHNWGSVDLATVMNHWYWGRAAVGPYTVIAAEIITEAEFDSAPITYFNLARDGKTIADENDVTTLFRTYGRVRHDSSTKPISDRLRFVYEPPGDELRYEVSLTREATLLVAPLLDRAFPIPFVRAVVQKMTGFDGVYHRFSGTAHVRCYRGSELVEEHESTSAIWELMYFGDAQG